MDITGITKSEFVKKIQDLKTQLSEKGKEIEKYKAYYNDMLNDNVENIKRLTQYKQAIKEAVEDLVKANNLPFEPDKQHIYIDHTISKLEKLIEE